MYLNPGGLGYVIQLLIAAFLVGLVWFKSIRRRIMRFFNKKSDADEEL